MRLPVAISRATAVRLEWNAIPVAVRITTQRATMVTMARRASNAGVAGTVDCGDSSGGGESRTGGVWRLVTARPDDVHATTRTTLRRRRSGRLPRSLQPRR